MAVARHGRQHQQPQCAQRPQPPQCHLLYPFTSALSHDEQLFRLVPAGLSSHSHPAAETQLLFPVRPEAFSRRLALLDFVQPWLLPLDILVPQPRQRNHPDRTHLLLPSLEALWRQ